MHENAWICDACGADVHQPLSREDPPTAWRTVIRYEDDVPGGTAYHFCSDVCVTIGTMPQDVQEQRRKDLELDRARALIADAGRARKPEAE